MEIHFWGVRGSVATPLTNTELYSKIVSALKLGIEAGLNDQSRIPRFIQNLPWYVYGTTGGDTTCVEVTAGGRKIILDAGTGIRQLGFSLMREFAGRPIEVSILVSHTHWDHISGFPFFVPAFIPVNKVTIYGVHEDLKGRFEMQQSPPFFPVPLKFMAADINFVQLEEGRVFRIGDIELKTMKLHHPGGCYAYRISRGGKSMVYATDGEYNDTSIRSLQPVIDFLRGADLMIFDAQYTLLDSVEKEDWGHSSAFIGIDIAIEAGVKQIVFVHHEPTYSDEKIWDIFQKSYEYLINYRSSEILTLHLSYEGLNLTI